MQKKRIIFILLLSTISLFCYSQDKQKTFEAEYEKNMETLDSLVAGYSSMPNYYIYFTNVGCIYEIRINDNYTERIFTAGHSGGTSTGINSKIIRSGKQRVTVKLLPEPGQTRITSLEPFTLKIGYKDFAELSPRPWHWVWEMPAIKIPKGGLPYYEFEGEFEAHVPRTVTGWSDCIDLRKIPDIEERVVAKFKELQQIMKNKEMDKLKQILAYKSIDVAKAFHETSKELELKNKVIFYKIEKADPDDWQEIEDYKLVFYADGRLATLESTKEEGFCSALLRIWEEDIDDEYYKLKSVEYEMRLGIRQGTDELIPIR